MHVKDCNRSVWHQPTIRKTEGRFFLCHRLPTLAKGCFWLRQKLKNTFSITQNAPKDNFEKKIQIFSQIPSPIEASFPFPRPTLIVAFGYSVPSSVHSTFILDDVPEWLQCLPYISLRREHTQLRPKFRACHLAAIVPFFVSAIHLTVTYREILAVSAKLGVGLTSASRSIRKYAQLLRWFSTPLSSIRHRRRHHRNGGAATISRQCQNSYWMNFSTLWMVNVGVSGRRLANIIYRL